MIVSAAVVVYFDPNYDDMVIIPVHRHKDCSTILKALHVEAWDTLDGFLTESGDFLSRVEAADHAYRCGQLTESAEEDRITILMSEDLW